MNKSYGTANTGQIDFVAARSGRCNVYLIQSGAVGDNEILLLQEKLNNYLAYILDGQLESEFPELATLEKVVQVKLQYPPEGILLDFFERIRELFQSQGIAFLVEIHGQDTVV